MKADSVISYFDIIPAFRPPRPQPGSAFIVVYHVRTAGFLSGLTAFCNPISMEVCSGDPDYFTNAFTAHVVAFFALFTINTLLDGQESAFKQFTQRALAARPRTAAQTQPVQPQPVPPQAFPPQAFQPQAFQPQAFLPQTFHPIAYYGTPGLFPKSADRRIETSSSRRIIRDDGDMIIVSGHTVQARPVSRGPTPKPSATSRASGTAPIRAIDLVHHDLTEQESLQSEQDYS